MKTEAKEGRKVQCPMCDCPNEDHHWEHTKGRWIAICMKKCHKDISWPKLGINDGVKIGSLVNGEMAP